MEKDYARIEKLITLRREYAARVTPVEQAIAKERRTFDEEEQKLMAGEWLSRRFDAGLFSLQVMCSASDHVTCANEFRLLTSFWHGFSPRTMAHRRKLSHFLPTAMRIYR